MKKRFFIIISILSLAILTGAVMMTNANTTSNDTISANTSSSTGSGENWTMNNYDLSMSRNSPQTTINKDNVNQLQVKWILNTGYPVENPPIIIGDTAYAQNNAMQVFAIDMKTGLNKWKYDPHVLKNGKTVEGSTSHGITYDNGVIYVPTGPKKTLVSLNATTGKKIWETGKLSSQKNYANPTPPIVYKGYVIVGSSEGDEPENTPPTRGTITAINQTNGHKIWKIPTVVGSWLKGSKNVNNGGGTTWSGGGLDTDTGMLYIPTGNPAPDFDTRARPLNTPYTDSMLAVNVTNGKIKWITPFIAKGTVLNVTIPNTHDWDTSWGSNIVTVKLMVQPKQLLSATINVVMSWPWTRQLENQYGGKI